MRQKETNITATKSFGIKLKESCVRQLPNPVLDSKKISEEQLFTDLKLILISSHQRVANSEHQQISWIYICQCDSNFFIQTKTGKKNIVWSFIELHWVRTSDL